MKWNFLLSIFMVFFLGCNRPQEKEQDVIVDNRPPDKIIVYAEKRRMGFT